MNLACSMVALTLAACTSSEREIAEDADAAVDSVLADAASDEATTRGDDPSDEPSEGMPADADASADSAPDGELGPAETSADGPGADAAEQLDASVAGDSGPQLSDGGVADALVPADAEPDGALQDGFVPVRFSRSDRSPCIGVSASGYAVEITDWGPCGVRSDSAVAPGTGVFYFEALRLTPRYQGGGIGLATAQAALTERAGTSRESMGVLGAGPVQNAGGSCSGASELDTATPTLGFVLDYRAATPLIHVLQENANGTAALKTSCSMNTGAPLYVFYSGDRAKVGLELQLNTGADTTNFPFHFSAAQVRAALSEKGQESAASALVMGFGKTHAAAPDTAPSLAVPADVTLAFGQPVTLEASATDAEEGSLDAKIQWLDVASPHHAPVQGTGQRFSFTPSSIGRHPVLVSVTDAVGLSAQKTVMVKVTGALPQAAPVKLVQDALTGVGITLSADGLSATFRGTGKDGIRANQGIYGRFWYFEVHRDSPVRNMGIGLVTGDGALNPYEPARVPWSCSLNVMHGFWIDLIQAGDWVQSPQDTDYGFAVDYRGEHPLVHILIRGALQTTLTLSEVWVPLYPMLYGNPPDAPQSASDMTINFGAKPFAFDPRAALSAKGVDASALELGWGLSSATSQ